jgi:hypothetical protein
MNFYYLIFFFPIFYPLFPSQFIFLPFLSVYSLVTTLLSAHKDCEIELAMMIVNAFTQKNNDDDRGNDDCIDVLLQPERHEVEELGRTEELYLLGWNMQMWSELSSPFGKCFQFRSQGMQIIYYTKKILMLLSFGSSSGSFDC